MRLFVCVGLTDRARKKVTAAARVLTERGVEGSPVPPENYHITLSFIGETDSPDCAIGALGSAAFEPFRVSFGYYGNFGNVEYLSPRGRGELIDLMLQVRDALHAAGVPTDDAQPVPHITLFRRSRRPEGFVYPEIEPFSMSINSLSLMRSTHGPRHPVYEEVFRKNFY